MDNPIVASAVDTRHSTDSPAASGSKTSEENPSANPRMNAVACEVEVIATGARPAEKGDQRELFTEETTTALVFENGGVLRLAAVVVPGQLLFLTHKETKREVVAQVTRKRDFRPMICYVEVEFSEPAPGFWSVEFPKMPAVIPVKGPQSAADESAQAEEDILADGPAEPTAAPSAQEVMSLKNEVEALREQLKLLQTQTVPRDLAAPAATPEIPGPTSSEFWRALAEVADQVPVPAKAASETLPNSQTASGEVSQELPTEISGALASARDAAPASASLATDAAESAFNEEDLLPKSALNFKDAKPPTKIASELKQKVAASSRSAAMRKDLLFATFALFTVGVAWYQNLLPWLSHPKNFSQSAAPSIAAQPARAPRKTASGQADSGKPPETSEDSRNASQSAALGTAQPSKLAVPETTAVKSAPDGPAEESARQEKPESAASARKRSATPPLNKAAQGSAAPPSDGAAIVPPKLIKSVRAVASPNALQDFGRGRADNVTFDALVDTSGHVKSTKALSGSAVLQSAAMNALKQYRYEPATKRGKPVPAHVTVTVKFLFEP